MMPDVFNSDMFSLVSLTDAINKLPYKPSRLGEMGLFQTQGVATTTIVIEELHGVLSLLPTVRRGGPATVNRPSKRSARSFLIPHIPLEDAVLADDVLNVRQFGSETQADTVAKVVNDKLQAMRQSHELTLEYHRIGAVKGIVLDADGATAIYNLFTEFGLTQTTQDFAFTVGSTVIRTAILAVIRAIETALGAANYDHIHCLAGKSWIDAFIDHDDVRAAYERYQDGVNLRNDPRKGFEFAGVTFEEYRGSIGAVKFVADTEAHFFPVGVPGLFKTYNAPADFVETAGTLGQPLYVKQERMDFDRGIRLHTQQNPLCMCTRPQVLVKGTMS
mgnify:CR=1 FL=1